jgi:hypothetical protein
VSANNDHGVVVLAGAAAGGETAATLDDWALAAILLFAMFLPSIPACLVKATWKSRHQVLNLRTTTRHYFTH